MIATPDGTLFLMDAGRLRKVFPDRTVTTIVKGLSGRGRSKSEAAKLNYHMGLWMDRERRVYLPAAAEKLVLRVDGLGKVSIVLDRLRRAPWGGMVDQDGRLWILEYDSANAVCVRGINGAVNERVFKAA